MRPFIPLLACLILASASASRAAGVNIAVDAGQFYNAEGIPLSANSLVILIADTGNDGFGSLVSGSLSVGDYLNGDDQVLYRGGIFIDDGLSVASFGATFVPLGEGLFPNLQTGDALAVVWFPDLTTASSSVFTGASYGLFTTTTPLNGSAAWSIPTAGASVDLKFYTEAVGGSYPESIAYATLAVIPEPGECALATVGLLGMAVLLRRRTRQGLPSAR